MRLSSYREISLEATRQMIRQRCTRAMLSDINLSQNSSSNSIRTSPDHNMVYVPGNSGSIGSAALAMLEEENELGTGDEGSVKGSFSCWHQWCKAEQEVRRC
jgi:hypothetical protein